MKRKDYKRNWDPGLVDEGWKQMKNILDLEMPEKKRWGIPIWWPIVAAASVVGFILLVLPEGKRDLDSQTGNDPSLAVQETPGMSGPDNTTDETHDYDGELKTMAQVQESILKAKENDQLLTGTVRDLNREARSKLEPSGSGMDIPAITPERTITQIPNPADPIHPLDGQPSMLKGLPTLPLDNFKTTYRSNPDIDLSYFHPAPSPHPVIGPDEDLAQSRRPDLVPAIAFGSGSYASLDNLSWIGGPSLRLNWKKLFLTSAVEYWSINTTKTFLFNKSTQAFAERTAILDNLNLGHFTQSDFSEYDINQLQYLKTSIRTGYKPNNRIWPFIGISSVFLIDEDIHFLPSTLNPLLNHANASTNRKDILRESNVAFDVGINYRFTSHFMLSLNYTHPWNSYLKDEFSLSSSVNITRQLLLGIHYQFE